MSHITTTSQAVSHEVGVEDLREKIKGLSKAGIEVGSKKHFNEQEVNPKKHFNKQAEAVAAAMRAAVRGQGVQKLDESLGAAEERQAHQVGAGRQAGRQGHHGAVAQEGLHDKEEIVTNWSKGGKAARGK